MRALVCGLALALGALGAAGAGAGRSLQSVTTNNQTGQTSIDWYAPGGKGSEPIPLNDGRLSPSAAPAEQVHLTYVNATSVVVSWATGDAVVVNGPLVANVSNSPFGSLSTVGLSTADAAAFPVKYGTSAGALNASSAGFTATYSQIYTGLVNSSGAVNSNPTANYSSPTIHHVQLTGLAPNTTYFYQVTGTGGAASATFNFTTPPALGSYPLRLGVYADVGQTYNSSATMDRMLAQDPDVITLIGDWTYADDYQTNGSTVLFNFPNNTFIPNITALGAWGTYQPRWDSWFRLAQPLLSHIPIIPNSGNHELEPQGNGKYFTTTGWGLDGGRQFNSYLARLPVQALAQQSGGAPLYFSTNVGPVHMIVLNNYENFLVDSPQFAWLQKDLAAVNRTKTPWVVAQWHAPWYSSYTQHYKETESMRVTMEPLFYAAGVDIVLNGHLHEYERTHAINNYKNDNCGTVHITMGDGGNVEGLYTTFVDQAPTTNCPAPGPSAIPSYQPGPWTPSFVYDTSNVYNGYCPTSQPAWSAFRQPQFGHSLITFLNETHAYFQWNRNLDDAAAYPDTVYIVRDRSCFNALGNGPASAPLLAPSASRYLNTTGVAPGLAVVAPAVSTASLG